MIRFVDLFAGIGGLRLGFEQAAAALGQVTQCVLASEIDEFARETYALNFGHKPEGDIYKIDKFPEFDFMLAGFPCQPFSYAGKQKGFGDTRGTLFFEIERVLEQRKPAGFLLENVRGLTTHDGGRTFQTIVTKLQKLGYGVQSLLLNSSDFAVPQNRVRVYMVGLLGREPILNIQSNRGAVDSHRFKARLRETKSDFTCPTRVVADVLERDAPREFDCSLEFASRLLKVLSQKQLSPHGVRMIDFRNGNSIHSWELGLKGECDVEELELMNAIVANRRRSVFGSYQDGKSLSREQIASFFERIKLDHYLENLVAKKYLRKRDNLYNPVSGNMSFEVFKFLDPESVSITVVSSDAHKLGVYYEGRLRRITPRECARLQGFPDSFKLNPNNAHAYRQLGNSVSVPVVSAVIRDLLTGNDLLETTETRAKLAAQRLSDASECGAIRQRPANIGDTLALF